MRGRLPQVMDLRFAALEQRGHDLADPTQPVVRVHLAVHDHVERAVDHAPGDLLRRAGLAHPVDELLEAGLGRDAVDGTHRALPRSLLPGSRPAPSSPRTSPTTIRSARVRNVCGIISAVSIPLHFDVTGSRACISCVQRRPRPTMPSSKSVSTVTIRVVSG